MNTCPSTALLPGVFLNLWETGVLLVGTSGIGKSEAALELISRGHRLIADDAVEFSLTPGGGIEGSCPTLLQGLLALRDIGVVDVRQQFGQHRVMNKYPLSLAIALSAVPAPSIPLAGIPQSLQLLGQKIPQYNLFVSGQRPLGLLIECLVRNHQFKFQGVDFNKLFIEKQARQIGFTS